MEWHTRAKEHLKERCGDCGGQTATETATSMCKRPRITTQSRSCAASIAASCAISASVLSCARVARHTSESAAMPFTSGPTILRGPWPVHGAHRQASAGPAGRCCSRLRWLGLFFKSQSPWSFESSCHRVGHWHTTPTMPSAPPPQSRRLGGQCATSMACSDFLSLALTQGGRVFGAEVAQCHQLPGTVGHPFTELTPPHIGGRVLD